MASRPFARSNTTPARNLSSLLSNKMNLDLYWRPPPAAKSFDMKLSFHGSDFNKYPAKLHAKNVARELEASSGLIYLPGQETVMLPDSDQAIQFRQLRYFYYLNGCDVPDCFFTYDIESDVSTLYIPDISPQGVIWFGRDLTIEQARERYDVDEVKVVSTLSSDINRWILKNNHKSPVYILHDDQAPKTTFSKVKIDSVSLQHAMDTCRVIKDDYEIDLIRRANDISTKAHKAVLESLHTFTNERHVEALFTEISIAEGAYHQSYNIIAAAGSNAAVLHYDRNNEPLKGRPFLLLDAGAELNCYASDVTRTYPISGIQGQWPSQEAKDIYLLVEKMQTDAINKLKKGVRYADIQRMVHDIAIEGLQKLGVILPGDREDAFKAGASHVFLPHGLGHHVGLEVHDVSPKHIMAVIDADSTSSFSTETLLPCLDAAHCKTTCSHSAALLDTNMIITVEPGLYFSKFFLDNAVPEEAAKWIDMEVARKYIAVGGVRLEDDILILEDGFENLTKAPKGEEMLRILSGLRH